MNSITMYGHLDINIHLCILGNTWWLWVFKSMWLFVNSIVLTGSKDGLEEKSKAPIQKTPLFQKSCLSITSYDGDLEVREYFSIFSLN